MRRAIFSVTLVLLTGCRARAGGVVQEGAAAPSSPVSGVDGGPAAEGEAASPFAVVAEGAFHLRRADDAVFAVTTTAPAAVIALATDGTMTVNPALARAGLHEVGVVTRGPGGALLVEDVTWSNSAAARSAMREVTERGVKTALAGARYTPFQRGAAGLVTLESDAPTPLVETFPTNALHEGKFAVFADGKKLPGPKIPEQVSTATRPSA